MSTATNILQRQAETLDLAERQREANRKNAGASRGLTIAVAREAGALGTEVATELGKRLNWPVYDQLLLERIAQEMGLRTQLLESVDEKRKGWLLEVVEGLVAATSVSELTYVRQLVQTILSLGTLGNCVIVGRGAAHILPPETTLRVRVVASVEDRIAAVKNRLHLTQEKAAKWVAETDHQRQVFVKDFFLKDPTDPHLYDLVLNTSKWTVGDCADLIHHGLRNLQTRK